MAAAVMANIPRYITWLLFLIGVCMAGTAVASALGVATEVHAISLKDVAYGAVGLLSVFVSMWTRRQDADIAESRKLAAQALEKAHTLELRLVAIRSRQEVIEARFQSSTR